MYLETGKNNLYPFSQRFQGFQPTRILWRITGHYFFGLFAVPHPQVGLCAQWDTHCAGCAAKWLSLDSDMKATKTLFERPSVQRKAKQARSRHWAPCCRSAGRCLALSVMKPWWGKAVPLKGKMHLLKGKETLTLQLSPRLHADAKPEQVTTVKANISVTSTGTALVP